MDILELYIPLDTLAQIAKIFLAISLLWVCQRPGRKPTIFPSGEAAGSFAPLNARPHLLRCKAKIKKTEKRQQICFTMSPRESQEGERLPCQLVCRIQNCCSNFNLQVCVVASSVMWPNKLSVWTWSLSL